MPNKGKSSSVSLGSWMLTIFMIAIPCVGIIYVIIGAIFSSNESRRNFYRAHLVWLAIIVGCYVSLFAIGYAPDFRKLYDQFGHRRLPEKSHASAVHRA